MNISLEVFVGLLILFCKSDAVTNSQYFPPRYSGPPQYGDPGHQRYRVPPPSHRPVSYPSYYRPPPNPIFAKLFEVFDYDGPLVKFDDDRDDFFDEPFKKLDHFPPPFNGRPNSGFRPDAPNPGFTSNRGLSPGFPPGSDPNPGFPPGRGPNSAFPPGRGPNSAFPPGRGPNTVFPGDRGFNSPFPPNSRPNPVFPPSRELDRLPPPIQPNDYSHEDAYRRYRDYFIRRFGTNLSDN